MESVDPRRIYVGNLPHEVTEEEILTFLKDYSPVNVKKVQWKEKSFAFVQLSTVENASQAIAKLNKTILRGRVLVLRSSSLQDYKKKPGPKQMVPMGTHGGTGEPLIKDRLDAHIFVSNLPFGVSEEDVRELFKDYKLEKIKLLHRETYSFAFLMLQNAEDARKAIKEMHGFPYRDQLVSCRAHRDPKKAKKDSGEDGGDTPVSLVKSKTHDQETPSNPSGKDTALEGKGKNKSHGDNLPTDVTKEDLLLLYTRYRPVSVPRDPHVEIRLGVVEVNPSDNVIRAVNHLNGATFKGSRLQVASVTGGRKQAENEPTLPALVPDCRPNPEDSEAVKEDVAAAKNLLLIPVEMRGSFVAAMLKACFSDYSWLGNIMNTSGELRLLMTNAYSNSPYFWAVLITEETYATLSNICMSLVKAEPRLPCLMKKDIQRGSRCLARCVLTADEEGTWSRCWVTDVATDYAVVFFVDYGVTDVVAIGSLRRLEDDHYWSTPPMAQPFLLLEGPDIAGLMGTVFKGRICGNCLRERHIQKFCAFPKED